MYMYVYARARAHTHTHTHDTYTRPCTHMHIHIYTIHTPVHAQMYLQRRDTHARTHARTHTHTHTQMHNTMLCLSVSVDLALARFIPWVPSRVTFFFCALSLTFPELLRCAPCLLSRRTPVRGTSSRCTLSHFVIAQDAMTCSSSIYSENGCCCDLPLVTYISIYLSIHTYIQVYVNIYL